jgi:2-polyprenyl-3-methyl-5-hydroxy-6-metoxy-1,4-benzoquinol methylase
MKSASEVATTADYTVRDQERMKNATRYFEWQFKLAEKQLGRRVLEIGCGLGNFTRHLLDRDLVLGIDVEEECINKRLGTFAEYPNLVSMYMDVQDKSFLDLRKYEPDSIACLNVLEHVKDDALALSHMHSVLTPGGTAVLIVPAFKSLYGPIDDLLGHYRRYSKQSMAQAATQAGFHVKTLRYMNAVGFFGWWFNARVLKKTEQSAAQIALFDSLVVPVMSKAEGLLEPPIGQSIFAVLEKPR